MESSRAGRGPRIRSLDGLRGVAAAIVVVHHALLGSSPQLADSYFTPPTPAPTWSLSWWLTRTPLHLLWAGPEMVLLFFVLSGYVLALPALRRGFGWLDASYYPRRLTRLYVPAWGALIFGALLHLTHEQQLPGLSWWLNAHAGGLSLSSGLWDATLIHQSSLWAYTSVLWTMNYEVWFSILLPLLLCLVLLCRRRRPLIWGLAGACLLLAFGGARYGNASLRYLPVFVLGSVLAFEIEHLRPRLAPRLLLPGAVLLCIGLLTLGYMWTGASILVSGGPQYLAVVLGACLAVWLAVVSPGARRLFETKPLQWLGSRSYSLYLVHEPIVVGVSFLLGGGGGARPVWVLLIALPLSLLAGELFWRLVERPAIAWARRSGRTVPRLVGQRHAAATHA